MHAGRAKAAAEMIKSTKMNCCSRDGREGLEKNTSESTRRDKIVDKVCPGTYSAKKP